MENSPKKVLIELNHVSVSYKLPTQKLDGLKDYVIRLFKGDLRYDKYEVLDDVSLKIFAGESIALVGRNGVGKSTLLRVIAKIIPPEKGEVNVHGSLIPMLSIGAGFDSNASGKENVFINGALLGYSKKEMESKYKSIVEFAELENFMNVPVKNYSSGMTSRLGFAIAVSTEPDVILVDEVLAVGDAKFRAKCTKKMEELQNKGVTFVVVSHNKQQVRELCKRAILIKDKKIALDGTVDEIYKAYES